MNPVLFVRHFGDVHVGIEIRFMNTGWNHILVGFGLRLIFWGGEMLIWLKVVLDITEE